MSHNRMRDMLATRRIMLSAIHATTADIQDLVKSGSCKDFPIVIDEKFKATLRSCYLAALKKAFPDYPKGLTNQQLQLAEETIAANENDVLQTLEDLNLPYHEEGFDPTCKADVKFPPEAPAAIYGTAAVCNGAPTFQIRETLAAGLIALVTRLSNRMESTAQQMISMTPSPTTFESLAPSPASNMTAEPVSAAPSSAMTRAAVPFALLGGAALLLWGVKKCRERGYESIPDGQRAAPGHRLV